MLGAVSLTGSTLRTDLKSLEAHVPRLKEMCRRDCRGGDALGFPRGGERNRRETGMTGVVLNNVVKRFGDVQVIHGVDLEIEDGEFCVFVGPSGCGKSTLLRMVAGLEETTEGKIHIGAERDVTDMDPSERGVAMVFQTYALYPHMTVAQNMGFGLKMTGHPKDVIEQKVGEASKILKLDPISSARPRRSRAASASGSPSAAPSSAARMSSSSTSRCPTSMPSCASRCGWRSRACTRKSAPR